MDKNLQFLELKRMDPDVISPSKRKKDYKENLKKKFEKYLKSQINLRLKINL